MSFFFSKPNSRQDVIQIRLLILAILFYFIGCCILTLAPVVRFHSWSTNLLWHHWVGFIVWLIGCLVFHKFVALRLPDRDPYLLPLISLLTAWGSLTIYRLDVSFGFRQTAWLAIGIALSILIVRSKEILNFLRRYKYIWLTTGLLLTLLTFVMGVYPGGSGPPLWLSFFGVFLQPSELLKILLIVFLAAYLAENLRVGFNLLQLLMPTFILVGAAFLILIAQHDLGTASLFIAIYAVTVYLALGKRRILLISFLVVILALIIGYQVYGVIQIRIEAWLNPWLDPNGHSYQIVQSIIAVANGGIFGRGIGLGSPGVVPVAQSDFIFPAIFEESGLLGAAGLILLYAIFMIRGFSISLRSPNQFQRFLAAGLTTATIVQAILIIGGSIRMLPLTGVTLPFVSYGGSSLVTSFLSAALLLVISNRSEQHPALLERGQPYRMVGGVLLFAFAGLLFFSAWWSFFRGDALLLRNDNPRRFISDRYVLRGSIYDQNNQLLASTTGEIGAYTRTLSYPPLSSVIGYSDANYGQAGLEASQDTLLRGVTGDNFWQVFKTRLLFGQYPKGYDLRTSIDLTLQQKADSLLEGQKGSIVVLNAESGEILAISTSPTFNSNLLAENMETWKTDADSPLLNRVTQGAYPPGSITGGLLLNYVTLTGQELPELPLFYPTNDMQDSYYCARQVETQFNWMDLISAGCPYALEELGSSMKPVDLYNLYKQVGLFDQPAIQIESINPVSLDTYSDITALFKGNTNLLVTPLQVALAYAPFSNGGYYIEPSLTTASRASGNTWELIKNRVENEKDKGIISPVFKQFSTSSGSGWSISASVPTQTGSLAWFVQGTLTNWRGVPIVVVVAMEDSSPSSTQNIGISVYQAATSE